jgi:hypothetical protein
MDASDLCLMLTPEEETAITYAQQQADKGGKYTKIPTSLRLDGIIYSDPESWVIWLNGRSIRAGESVDSIRILKVTPEAVTLIWFPKPDQGHQICLKPNGSFQGEGFQP